MRRLLLPVLLVLGAAVSLVVSPALAGAAVPSVTFSTPTKSPVPDSSGALEGTIATADFNRDGHADVAAYSANFLTEEGSLDVWLSSVGGGSTSWSWAGTPLTTPSVPRFEAGYVATGQMNPEADSDPDLIALSVSGEEGESVLSVYLGTGVGTFATSRDTPLPGYANGRPTIADVNGDGIPDVLIPTIAETSNGWQSEVVTLIGKGEGLFEAPIVSTVDSTLEPEPYEAVYATGIAVGEFTGSGHLDVAVSQGYGSPHDLVVMGGDGAGHFIPADYLSLGKGSTGVVSGDFDGNGHSDLAVPLGVSSTEHPEFDSGERVGLAFGNGAGAFTQSTPQAPEWEAENPYSYAIATADLNGDGKPDLLLPVASDPQEGGVWALLGNGDGTFAETSKAELEGDNAWDAQGADFDGDGHEDIVALVSTGAELELAVYDNTSAPSFQLGSAAVDAGTVEVGQAGATTLSLTNAGNYELSISSLSVSGTDAAGFTVSGCATIAPGTTCEALVTFRPSRIGAESATLTIGTDDPANPTATVALSGTGAVTTTAPATGTGSDGGSGKKEGSTTTGPAGAGKLKLPKTAAVAKNGKASLKLSCSGGDCSGKLTLTIATKKKVGGKTKDVALPAGSATYSLTSGQSKTVIVKLSAAAKKLLAAAPGHKVATTVTVAPSKGAKSTAKLTLIGTAPKKN